MRHVAPSPSAVKVEVRRRALGRFTLGIFLLAALFFGLGALSHLPKLLITDVLVEGTRIVSPEEVSARIREYLNGNQALVYARGNIFLFSKERISSKVSELFPRIESVTSIERNGSSLIIEIKERTAAYAWCGSDAPLYEERFKSNPCYFIDHGGFIFDRAPFFTDGVYLVFYGGISDPTQPIGTTLATTSSMAQFSDFVEGLADIGLPAHSVVIGLDGQHTLLLDHPSLTGKFATLLFNEDESLISTLRKVEAAVGEADFKAVFAERPLYLEYIDTRFQGRVLYRFEETSIKQ